MILDLLFDFWKEDQDFYMQYAASKLIFFLVCFPFNPYPTKFVYFDRLYRIRSCNLLVICVLFHQCSRTKYDSMGNTKTQTACTADFAENKTIWLGTALHSCLKKQTDNVL